MIPIVPQEETVSEQARRENRSVGSVAKERALRGISALIFTLLVVGIFYVPNNKISWVSAGILIVAFIVTIWLAVSLKRKPPHC